MNDAVRMANHSSVEVLPSLMIPLATDVLLVPTVTVAEIVSPSAPESIADSPDWLLGYFHWREQKVPLLSMELLSGAATAAETASRIVVFNNTGVSSDLPFIAIVANGIPKLVQVQAEDLSLSDHSPGPFENLRVILNGEPVVIPEISSLERVYLDWYNSL